jgi:hypothetical protein
VTCTSYDEGDAALPDKSAGGSGVGGRAHNPPGDSDVGCPLVGAVQHVGIEIDLPGPLDRARVALSPDLLEQITVLTNRCENAAAGKQLT